MLHQLVHLRVIQHRMVHERLDLERHANIERLQPDLDLVDVREPPQGLDADPRRDDPRESSKLRFPDRVVSSGVGAELDANSRARPRCDSGVVVVEARDLARERFVVERAFRVFVEDLETRRDGEVEEEGSTSSGRLDSFDRRCLSTRGE
jgi:hypothetical protein